MKKRILIIPGLLALLPGQALAQSGLDQEVAFSYYTLPFIELKIYRLEWWGHQGRTYFTQASDDLVNWAYFQEIDSGNDSVIWYEVPEDGDKIFLRLQYSDQPTTDPFTSDFDGDHISNWDEITMNPVQGNPLDDSSVDGDLIPDDWERFHGLDPTVADGDLHSDEDRLSNYEEFLNYTDPKNADTDDDHLSDDWEVAYALNPLVDEGTALDDTDGDGLQNYIESTANTSPFSGDTDGDLLPDEWEFLNGTDPTFDDANGDGDGDGLVNRLEYANNLNPRAPDTDYDGLSDGDEVHVYNTSGEIEDSDGDGWIDGSEVLASSSPTNDSSVPNPVIRILSGNDQVAAAGTPLQGSFQFSIETADGTPLPKAPVALSASSPTFGQDGGAFLIADPGTQQGPTVPSGYTFVEVEQVSLVADRNGTVLGVGSPVFLKMPVSANIDDVIDISVQSGGSTTHLQATVVSQQDAPVIPPSLLSSTLIDAQTNTHQVTWTNSVTNGPGYTIAVQLNNGSWMTLGTAGPTSTSFSATVPGGITNPNFSITGNNLNSSPSAQSVALESSFAEIDLGQCYPFNLNTKGQVLAEMNLEVKRWDLGTWESLTMPSSLGWVVDFYDLNNNGSMLGYELIGDHAQYTIWNHPDSPEINQLPKFLGLPDVFMSFINGFDDRQRLYGRVDLTGIGVYADISFIGEKILLTEVSNSSPAHDFWGFSPGIHNGSGDFVGTINEWSPSITEFFTRRINGGSFEVLDYMPVAIGKDGTTLGLEHDLNPIDWELDTGNIEDELIVDDGVSRLKIPLSEFAAGPDWGTGISTGNPDGSWYSHSCGFLIHSDMAEKEQFVVGPGALFKRMFSENGVPLGFQKYTMPEGFFPTDVSENGMIVGYRLDENDNPQGVLLVEVDCVPDYDRDGSIRQQAWTDGDGNAHISDYIRAAGEELFYFWINDDNDDSASEVSGDDIPGSQTPDFSSSIVDGTRDLVDYFPVFIDLHGFLDLLVLGDVELSFLGPSVNYVSPSDLSALGLDEDNVGGYLRNVSIAQALGSAVKYAGSIPFSNEVLEKMRDGQGLFLMDAASANIQSPDQPLRLVLDYKGTRLLDIPMPVAFSNVEDMYRHVNVAGAIQGISEITSTETGDPQGLPDTHTKNRYIVFIHGFNVSQQEARGWNAEIFKRLFWSGLDARFVGLTWHGNTTPNYYRAVRNAFLTSEQITAALDFMDSNELVVAAHSLGNMVVSSALSLDIPQRLSANQYFLLNAAVPIEAYDALQTFGTGSSGSMWSNIRHPEWSEYADRLTSAFWHELFTDGKLDGNGNPVFGDTRQDITWKGRFAEITNAWNFYSTGEEVLRNASGNVPTLFSQVYGKGPDSWTFQEMNKGRGGIHNGIPFVVDGLYPVHGGWGFSQEATYWSGGGFYPPNIINSLDDVQLREEPFFYRFDDSSDYNASFDGVVLRNAIGDSSAVSMASQPFTQYKILAEAIPATTFAAGSNAVVAFDNDPTAQRNLNMQTEYRIPGEWPAERLSADPSGPWLHSDLTDVAYPYIFRLFDHLIETGNLK